MISFYVVNERGPNVVYCRFERRASLSLRYAWRAGSDDELAERWDCCLFGVLSNDALRLGTLRAHDSIEDARLSGRKGCWIEVFDMMEAFRN